MTPSPRKALACAAFVATLSSTPSDAASQQHKPNIQHHVDQHGLSQRSSQPVARERRRSSWRSRKPQTRITASVSRSCLTPETRDLLGRIEARFGKVELVSTCRPGARMPNGDASWHARNKAFDFIVRKGIDKRDVMVWLGNNSPGVTISYRSMPHIHTDTGSFHKVIYNAASHEAGERAVAIWQARAAAAVELANATPLPKPRRINPRAAMLDSQLQFAVDQPIVLASLGDDFVLEESATRPPAMPMPIGPGDRRDIFRRYIESQDVVVAPHTSLSCNDGKPFPDGLVRLLNDAAAHFGRTAYVNSGYRTAARNRRVGGARNSQHLKCRAVDFRVAGVGVPELRRYVMANLNRWGIGGLGTYRSHIHADARPLTKAARVVTWTGGHKRYAKRRHQRYAAG